MFYARLAGGDFFGSFQTRLITIQLSFTNQILLDRGVTIKQEYYEEAYAVFNPSHHRSRFCLELASGEQLDARGTHDRTLVRRGRHVHGDTLLQLSQSVE